MVDDADDAEHMGLHGRPHRRYVDGGRHLWRAAGYPGVVDEHVEASGAVLDQPGGGHARVLGHVERYTERIDAKAISAGGATRTSTRAPTWRG